MTICLLPIYILFSGQLSLSPFFYLRKIFYAMSLARPLQYVCTMLLVTKPLLPGIIFFLASEAYGDDQGSSTSGSMAVGKSS